MSLSERLRILRGTLGQKEFAKRIGSSQTGVSAYEKGQRKPDYETLIRVSQEFGVTLDWLLLGAEPMYCSSHQEEKTSDSRKNEEEQNNQLIENNKEKIQTLFKISDTSENLGQQHKGTHAEKVMELQERLLSSQERLLAATEQMAELRLQLERRDMRIHELEKENAGLREAQKGAAALQHDAEWRAG